MPVILRNEQEIETWLTAPAEDALKLQRPLPDGALKVVMTGEKEDVVDTLGRETGTALHECPNAGESP